MLTHYSIPKYIRSIKQVKSIPLSPTVMSSGRMQTYNATFYIYRTRARTRYMCRLRYREKAAHAIRYCA